MLANSWLLGARPFDPYPFILLNLVLSCLAALQAPVITMSQKRQGDRDRQRAMHDYQSSRRYCQASEPPWTVLLVGRVAPLHSLLAPCHNGSGCR
ncbi:MAG TPA: DUF1003 domain-containing protein [Gammaproteobacteria bacterium]|nr:DUF1003 domain-containing protein [Gammaproteobacteria bacterium]